MSLLNDFINAAGGGGGIAADLEQLTGHLGNGGLQAMLGQFEQGGLGQVAQSWIGNGANLPVSTEQLQAVLGSEKVTALAQSLGIDTSQVAAALPGLVDHLTPGGQLPLGNIEDMLGQAVNSGALGNLLGGLFKS
jgi:uncharacterized protein YidB (DUF937 family)